MKKKREYTHDDMEELGVAINALRIRARQIDQDIRSGAISHEQWECAAHELLERKLEIMEILSDVARYEMELRERAERERTLRLAAEARLAILESKARDKKS